MRNLRPIEREKRIFVLTWLAENTRYDYIEVLKRYYGEHQMSAGMRADVDAAEKYADEQMKKKKKNC